MPSANTITTFYTFSPGTLIRSSYVNTNFSNFRGHLIPIDPTATSSPNLTYDLGGDGHSWMNNYSGVWVAQAQSTPAGNPSTTTQYKLYMKSDGNFYKLSSAGTETALNGGSTLPGTTKGDLAVHDGSATVRLPIGSNGQVLTADSSATTGVAWKTPTSSSDYAVTTVAADYSATVNDQVIRASITSGSMTVYLPTSTSGIATGHQFIIMKKGAGNNTVNINAASINGTTTTNIITENETVNILWNGGSYDIVSRSCNTEWFSAGALSITATTSAPTKASGITTDRVLWRRVGDSAHIRMNYKQSNATSAAAGSGDYIFVIPSSIGTIDTTKVDVYTTVEGWNSAYTNSYAVGNAEFSDSTNDGIASVVVYNSTGVRVMGQIAASQAGCIGSAGFPLTGTTIFYSLDFIVPISGWRS